MDKHDYSKYDTAPDQGPAYPEALDERYHEVRGLQENEKIPVRKSPLQHKVEEKIPDPKPVFEGRTGANHPWKPRGR